MFRIEVGKNKTLVHVQHTVCHGASHRGALFPLLILISGRTYVEDTPSDSDMDLLRASVLTVPDCQVAWGV